MLEKEKEESKEEEMSFDEILETLKVITGKTPSESIAEAIKDLGNEEKIMFYTDVEKREIPYLSLMKVIAKRYHSQWLESYVNYELMLRVSNKRQGRKELVKVVAGVKKALEEKVKGFFRRHKEEEED